MACRRTVSAIPPVLRSTSDANCSTSARRSPQYRKTIAAAAPPQSASSWGRKATSRTAPAGPACTPAALFSGARTMSSSVAASRRQPSFSSKDDDDQDEQRDDNRGRRDHDGGGA